MLKVPTVHEVESRGWNMSAYGNALKDGDEDAMTINHPSNWMTEDEVEHTDALTRINAVVAFLFNLKESN